MTGIGSFGTRNQGLFRRICGGWVQEQMIGGIKKSGGNVGGMGYCFC